MSDCGCRSISTPLTVSIIINTDGRAECLDTALRSLLYQRYANFEIVVVTGPTADHTTEILAPWVDRIKIGHCPVRNLSKSRNIGLEISSGEVVAFLDDDSIAEPEWLDDVMPSFEDARVAVAGGFLHDHTGKGYQWKFGTADRFGGADTSWHRAAPEFNYPMSFNFPHVMANSAFRRAAILDAGGFDEEYDYYLDETDMICRLVDRGWLIAQLDKGFVHHKFMASTIRNKDRVLTAWHPIIKNKLYFALMNGGAHITLTRAIDESKAHIQHFRDHVAWAVREGKLPAGSDVRFEDEADRAFRQGLLQGLNGKRQLPSRAQLLGAPGQFKRFASIIPAASQRCFVFTTSTYPPGQIGGIGRYVHHLARGIALQGHQVHVLTRSDTHDRVDFEDGVWVHRLVVGDKSASRPQEFQHIPTHIWSYSQTMLEETREIAARRLVDCVVTPIWDVEGIAFETEPTLPHVVSLHTTLHSYLDSNPHRWRDAAFMRDFGTPVLDAERRLLMRRPLLANSEAIIDEIELAYDVTLDPDRCALVPHGLDDWCAAACETPAPLAKGGLRIVFVGRFEPRKGVDVLMQVAPAVLERHPQVWLDFVGNDTVEGPDGAMWRSAYESRWPTGGAWRQRIAVHGEVSEQRLRGFYTSAHVVVAPSRFESFGLVHLEAMMYGRPVIGCRIGGMAELIDDGETGLLAEPGDAASLERCIERLINSEALRTRLGAAARQAFLSRFTAERMATSVVKVLSRVADDTRRTGGGIGAVSRGAAT